VLLPSSHVLYASSEGRAGIIAATFDDFIQLVVACPYWLDILNSPPAAISTRCGARRSRWRRRSMTETTFDDARDTIRTALDLPEQEDHVGAFYEAVAASDAIVRATDGSPFTTLFNRFTIDSNPMLRDVVA
jgi:hypothetical protein